MTYLGAERVVPGYNLMGIAKAALEAAIRYLAWDLGPQGVRVNGISAGPMRTLSARGVGNINEMFGLIEQVSPLRRNICAGRRGVISRSSSARRRRRILTGDILLR